MQMNELISPNRVDTSLTVTSKKRLLEKISNLLRQDEPELDENAAFQSLFEREKLGSTAIGEGVALPHGRLKGINKAIGAFAILNEAMDYDAIDHKPVKMVFALLVPEHANKEHLDILADLANKFRNKQLRERLLNAHNGHEIYQCLIE